jgi:anti-anti-sigma regulatory factor
MDDGCLGQFRCSGALRLFLMSIPPGLAIGGDVDEATYPALVDMLGEVARGRGEVHVDLSAVEFCDLAGLRAIVRLATAGRTVVLHGLATQLETVLGILGWEGTPGLVIDNQPSGLRLPPAGPDAALLSESRAARNAGTRHRADAR